jgi:rod shape-determining protein MreD
MAQAETRVYGLGPALAPVATLLVLAILSAVPVPVPDYAAVAPNFLLMALYHWTLYRPSQVPFGAVFLIGLFYDLLTTGPGAAVGLTPLVLMLARLAVLANRRSFIGRSFPYVWAGFAVLAIGANGALWAGGTLLNRVPLEPRGFLFHTALTVAFFPVMALLLARIQRATQETA